MQYKSEVIVERNDNKRLSSFIRNSPPGATAYIEGVDMIKFKAYANTVAAKQGKKVECTSMLAVSNGLEMCIKLLRVTVLDNDA